MRAQITHLCFVIFLLLATGCGAAAPTAPPAPANTPQLPSLAPQTLATPSAEAVQAASPQAAINAATATLTPEPFALQFTPVPTETPLSTLELPTEAANLPALQDWDGLPTYLAESKPGFYFRLRFDPTVWALTNDQYGFPALGDRQVPGCTMTPSAGRGLALNSNVEHEVKKIGTINYQVSTAFVGGVRQFVTYTGGDGNIYTAFQVSFQDQADQCLMDAENALSGLRSVVVSQATPIATP